MVSGERCHMAEIQWLSAVPRAALKAGATALKIAPLITDRIPLERATSAYEKLLRGMESCYSIVLTT